MDDLVAKALARRKELLSELRQIERFLKTARSLGSAVDKDCLLVGQLDGVRPDWMEAPRPADLVEATARVLRAEGQPLERGSLFRKLVAAGVRMPGKDPLRNYGTILWRSKRFQNLEGRYWLKAEEQEGRG